MAEADPRKRRASFLFLSLLAIVALGRGVAHELTRPLERTRIADRYAPLASLLPVDATELAWITDEPGTSLAYRLHYEAQYALAPRILRENAKGLRFTVADLARPERLPELCARERLRVVLALANGAVLLEPAGP